MASLDPGAASFVPRAVVPPPSIPQVCPTPFPGTLCTAAPLHTVKSQPSPATTVVLKRLPPLMDLAQLEWGLNVLPVKPVCVRPNLRADGIFTGVAFVDYMNADHAACAMGLLCLQAQQLFGPKVKVETLRARPQRRTRSRGFSMIEGRSSGHRAGKLRSSSEQFGPTGGKPSWGASRRMSFGGKPIESDPLAEALSFAIPAAARRAAAATSSAGTATFSNFTSARGPSGPGFERRRTLVS